MPKFALFYDQGTYFHYTDMETCEELAGSSYTLFDYLQAKQDLLARGYRVPMTNHDFIVESVIAPGNISGSYVQFTVVDEAGKPIAKLVLDGMAFPTPSRAIVYGDIVQQTPWPEALKYLVKPLVRDEAKYNKFLDDIGYPERKCTCGRFDRPCDHIFTYSIENKDEWGTAYTAVYRFPKGTNMDVIKAQFESAGVDMNGWELTPSSYDCTGRWWPFKAKIVSKGDYIEVRQRWNCDV